MERPGRLGAVFVVVVSLAALSVYLLTRPSAMPPPGEAAEAPLIDLLLRMLGSGALQPDARHLAASIVGACNVALLYGLLGRLGVAPSTAAWLTVAFGFGTVHWWTAASGEGAGLAHVVAVLFMLLALHVAFSGRLAIVTGLLLGCAVAVRLPVVLTLPLVMALYAARPVPQPRSDRLREQLLAVAPLGVGLLLPLVYAGVAVGGPYGLESVPQHLHAALLRSFDLAPEGPWFRVNWTATSLLLTSPLYVWLVRARSRAPVVRWAWLAVALVAGATLLGPSVGSPQFGYQPSLDVAPVLFVLLGWVFREGMGPAARAAVLLSAAVNTYGMVAVGVLDPPFAGW